MHIGYMYLFCFKTRPSFAYVYCRRSFNFRLCLIHLAYFAQAYFSLRMISTFSSPTQMLAKSSCWQPSSSCPIKILCIAGSNHGEITYGKSPSSALVQWGFGAITGVWDIISDTPRSTALTDTTGTKIFLVSCDTLCSKFLCLEERAAMTYQC